MRNLTLLDSAPGLNGRFEFAVAASTVARRTFAEDVLDGLSAPAKWLGCSWLYDRRGSELFEQICDLPEYYLTRTERAILENEVESIAHACRDARILVELGSGSSAKTRVILDAFLRQAPTLTYCPIDISPEILYCSALDLIDEFPRLTVRALAADYLEGLRSIGRWADAPRLLLFLGSTIGNFDPYSARAFLTEVRRTMSPADRLLIGVDLAKSPAVIEPAYNDAQAVTADFNMNLLVRINRELGGQFDPALFEHQAPYLPDAGRVEMRLVSRISQRIPVDVLGRTFPFDAGEAIHTESCYKYTERQIHAMAAESDLEVDCAWFDSSRWFTLALLRPARDRALGAIGRSSGPPYTPYG